MKTNVTARVDTELIDYYGSNFKTTHTGLVIAVEGYPRIREDALKNIVGKFPQDEFLALVLVQENRNLSAEEMFSRRLWEAQIADAHEIGRFISPLDELITMTRSLSGIERFVLREIVNSFHNNPSFPLDLDGLLERFAPQKETSD